MAQKWHYFGRSPSPISKAHHDLGSWMAPGSATFLESHKKVRGVTYPVVARISAATRVLGISTVMRRSKGGRFFEGRALLRVLPSRPLFEQSSSLRSGRFPSKPRPRSKSHAPFGSLEFGAQSHRCNPLRERPDCKAGADPPTRRQARYSAHTLHTRQARRGAKYAEYGCRVCRVWMRETVNSAQCVQADRAVQGCAARPGACAAMAGDHARNQKRPS